MQRLLGSLLLLCSLAACVAPPPPPPPASAAPTGGIDARTAVRNFITVVDRVEPVAEQICAQRSPQLICDFRIVVDDTPGAPANAFQTLNEEGRPILAFTIPLIAETRNQDELAFIMAHEAAHHIQGHLFQQRRNATLGAAILGQLASAAGLETQRSAQQLGAVLGARTYSKDFELEADALGTRITAAAGYDPLKGAEFFTRIPDPGNRFLGTHPANADRIATVQRVANAL